MAASPNYQSALAELYEQHKHRVFNLAFHLTNNPHTAEDLLQDVFVRLLRGSPVELQQPLPYLRRAVLNGARDRARRAAPERLPDGDLVAAGPPPWHEAVQAERTREVAEALAGLPPEQREVVVLHVFENLGFAAIGELCGVSRNTAMSRYRYAREKLHQSLSSGTESSPRLESKHD